MLLVGGVGDFVREVFLDIWCGMIDTVVYAILTAMYGVWTILAKVDIFGGSSGAQVIYETFTERIYTVIAIVMVFIFAYKLLCYIMDPDGKSGTPASSYIKNILISIVMVVVAPLVFKYMAVFQYHIVANNTIPSIVLGTNGGNEVIPPGKQLAMITLMSFYYPEGYNYNSFVTDPNATSCDGMITNTYPEKAPGEWGTLMMEWCKDDDSTPGEFTQSSELHELVGEEEGVVYMWILCTVGGIAVCYFLFQYCLSIGTRAARLAFLQIIAPVPILLRIFDKPSYFDPWFKEMKKTYLDLFLRIAIISFVVFLCTLIPSLLNVIFTAAGGAGAT